MPKRKNKTNTESKNDEISWGSALRDLEEYANSLPDEEQKDSAIVDNLTDEGEKSARISDIFNQLRDCVVNRKSQIKNGETKKVNIRVTAKNDDVITHCAKALGMKKNEFLEAVFLHAAKHMDVSELGQGKQLKPSMTEETYNMIRGKAQENGMSVQTWTEHAIEYVTSQMT